MFVIESCIFINNLDLLKNRRALERPVEIEKSKCLNTDGSTASKSPIHTMTSYGFDTLLQKQNSVPDFRKTSGSLSPRRNSQCDKQPAYPVKVMLGKYHIVEEKDKELSCLHCEPNEPAEKPQCHQSVVDIGKLHRKVFSYADGISLNEKRFENINKLPEIFTKTKYFQLLANV